MRIARATALLVVCAWAAAASVRAQSIDYDPRRPSELRACDEHEHRGRSEQAQRCYSGLLRAGSGLVQAEAAWALGDLQQANVIFRKLTSGDARAVQSRLRWARLFLQTHQYADSAGLFREALKLAPDDVHAKVGLARVFAERFEGEARPLLDEALEQDPELIEALLLRARMALEEGQLDQAGQSPERARRIAAQRKLPPLEVYSLTAALDLSRDRDSAAVARPCARVQPPLRSRLRAARALLELSRRWCGGVLLIAML